MYIGVLGPLVVRSEGSHQITVPAALQRGVLAILLSRANKVVSRDELVETLWDGQDPDSARTTLATYVSRLRRVLGPDLGERIRTQPPGYLVDIAVDEYDCTQAADLETRARLAAENGDWPAVGELAGAGLGLWRGIPYQDVPVPRLHREDATVLDALRVRLTELTVEADLRLGRTEAAISVLTRLTEEEPLRERFYERLMTVLSEQGRRAEALSVYHRARVALRDSLGLDPGPDLVRVHHSVLAASAAGRPEPKPAPAPAPSPAPSRIRVPALEPRQLPPAARHFTGRADELATMDAAAEDGQVLVVSGMAGMGKTALAVQWAHRVAARYPDGQLFVDLRGFDPHSRPLTAHDACALLLESLGVASAAVPADPGARTALYRTVVADRRLLVVLDNAWEAAQVRPLIPGTAASQVVVTSRNRLAGLVAADGARPVVLGKLGRSLSLELLARRAGIPEAADEAAAAALAEACDGLPLALTIAAARLQLDPGLRWSSLSERLRDRRAVLTALDADDASLRAVFDVSYQRLSDRAASLFRLLDVHPGPDLSRSAAAALADDDVETVLDELVGASLLSRHAERFQFHALIRAYAGEAACEDPPEARDAARRRVYDHYLRSGIAADRVLQPTREPLGLPEAVPGSRPESIDGEPEAWSWFDAERHVLPAVIALAARAGDDEYAHLLPWMLTTYLFRRGDWTTLAELQVAAAEAADRTGDPAARARTHNDAGAYLLQIRDLDAALKHLELSAALYRDLGDLRGAWLSEANMGQLHHILERHTDAAAHARRALDLAHARGWEPDIALTTSMVAWSLTHCDEHEEALALAAEAIGLHRRLGDRNGQAHAHDTVGLASFHLGRHAEALDAYDRALGLFRGLGDVRHQARVLTRIAQTHQAAGRPDAAREAWTEAMVMFDDVGAPDGEAIRDMLDLPRADL
ncbi:AfsR/SARP family transcriptional regulator [Catenulispora subtropica]|uniref:BTAD domain-containing putative transcriptional regulator n=1 Tax=Catenulispora subtropica TaxID=450798 RepID=A0ABP5CC74_9ACTN